MIVLDTHVVIWDALQKDKIPKQVYRTINKADEQNEILISDISLWEISMLIYKKRLKIDSDIHRFISAVMKLRNYTVAPINAEIAAKSIEIVQILKSDPADSIIMATAFEYDATLITADQKMIDSEIVNVLMI